MTKKSNYRFLTHPLFLRPFAGISSGVLSPLRDLLISRCRGLGIFLPFCGIESRFFLRLGHRRFNSRPAPLPITPRRAKFALASVTLSIAPVFNTCIAKRAAPPARSQCGCGALRSVCSFRRILSAIFCCLPSVRFLFGLFMGILRLFPADFIRRLYVHCAA